MKKYGYVSMFATLLLVGFEAEAVAKMIKIIPGKNLPDKLKMLYIAYGGQGSDGTNYGPSYNLQKIVAHKSMTLSFPNQSKMFPNPYINPKTVTFGIYRYNKDKSGPVSNMWPLQNLINGTYILDYDDEKLYYLTQVTPA